MVKLMEDTMKHFGSWNIGSLGGSGNKKNLPSFTVATTEKVTPNDSLGLSFFESSSEIHILDINEDGLFASSDLKVGQTIVAINGKDCPTTATAVQSLLRKAVGPITIVAVGQGIKISSTPNDDDDNNKTTATAAANFWKSMVKNYKAREEEKKYQSLLQEAEISTQDLSSRSLQQQEQQTSDSLSSSNNPASSVQAGHDTTATTSMEDYEAPSRPPIPERLVDYFCVIGPQLKVENSNLENPSDLQFEAKLVDCYPPSREDMEFPDYLPMFCFPSGYRLKSKRKEPTISTFMLTSGAGHRLYGSAIYLCESLPLTDLCELFWENSLELPSWLQQGSFSMKYFLPKCLVIISHHAFYDVQTVFLTQLLRIFQTRKVPLPLERYIANFVHDVPLPSPGSTKVRWNVFTKDATVCIEQPGKNELPLVNFSYQPLFRTLSVSNILVVWGILLQEGRVVLRSEHMALLTPVAEGLMSLLFPLTWQGMYIPVLPSHMVVDVLDAPVPFLIGVVGKSCPQPDGVVVCDIDQDLVQLGWDHTNQKKPQRLPILPKKLSVRLKAEIESVADPLYLIPSCGVKGRITCGAFELVENSKRESYAPMMRLRQKSSTNTHRDFILANAEFVQKRKPLRPKDFYCERQGQIFVSAPECDEDEGGGAEMPPRLVRSDGESSDEDNDGDTGIVRHDVKKSPYMTTVEASNNLPKSWKDVHERLKYEMIPNQNPKNRKPLFLGAGYSTPSPYVVVSTDAEMEKTKLDIAKGLYVLDENMAEKTRYIFLRFFATLLRHYKIFVDDKNSFRTKDFLHYDMTDLSSGSRKFVASIIKSQMFERFLYECPDRRKLFDELIILQNEAEDSEGVGKTLSERRREEETTALTPFLNMLPTVSYDIVPAAPCHVGVGVGRTFTYEGFPKLDPEELVANNTLDPISAVCHGTLCSPTWWLSDD